MLKHSQFHTVATFPIAGMRCEEEVRQSVGSAPMTSQYQPFLSGRLCTFVAIPELLLGVGKSLDILNQIMKSPLGNKVPAPEHLTPLLLSPGNEALCTNFVPMSIIMHNA